MLRRSALVARPASHLFDIIEAAEHCPHFLPWCAGAQIISRDESMVSADIRVRWGGMKFEFRTRNPKQRPEHMANHLEHGPFRRFDGEWRLKALTDAACKVELALDCEFDSALMSRTAGPMFDRISDTLVDAFVQRAQALPPAPVQDAALGTPAVGGPASCGGRE